MVQEMVEQKRELRASQKENKARELPPTTAPGLYSEMVAEVRNLPASPPSHLTPRISPLACPSHVVAHGAVRLPRGRRRLHRENGARSAALCQFPFRLRTERPARRASSAR